MARFLRLGALAVGVLLGAMGVAGGYDGIDVEITADQRVTISARTDSLWKVLDELCWKAGADLLYSAPDHAFAGKIEGLYVEDALSRLLRGKSYILEFGPSTAGRSRVKTVRVLGPLGEAYSARTPRERPKDEALLRVPMRILDAAFGEDDSERQAAAVHELVETIKSDPDRRQAFLMSDPVAMGKVLGGYPHAPAVLRRLIGLPGLDDDARAQLAAMLAVLE